MAGVQPSAASSRAASAMAVGAGVEDSWRESCLAGSGSWCLDVQMEVDDIMRRTGASVNESHSRKSAKIASIGVTSSGVTAQVRRIDHRRRLAHVERRKISNRVADSSRWPPARRRLRSWWAACRDLRVPRICRRVTDRIRPPRRSATSRMPASPPMPKHKAGDICANCQFYTGGATGSRSVPAVPGQVGQREGLVRVALAQESLS